MHVKHVLRVQKQTISTASMKNIMRLKRLRVFPTMVALFETTLIHLASTLQSRAEKISHKTIFCILTVIFEFAEKHKANSYWVLWVPHCIVCKPKPPIQKKVKAFFATDHFSLLVLTWVQAHWHFPLRPFMETRVREGKLSHWNHVEIFPAQWL